MSAYIIFAAAARAAYDREFLKLGFERKYGWKPAETTKYFVPAKFFIKRYIFNAGEKRWNEAQKLGLGKKITVKEYGSPDEVKEVNDLLRNTDYLLCKEETKGGYSTEGIYYILTGAEFEYGYYGISIDELKKFKEEQDEIFREEHKNQS